MKGITIPSKVTNIAFSAFEECESLETIKLSNDLKNIEARAFHKTALKEITLPSKVTKVEYAAFKSCPNLSKVTLKSTKKAPVFEKKVFGNTKSGLPFYVKNKTVAKSLKQALKGTGVKKAKIYVGKKLVYKNVQ